jgi:hypothetical protein
MVKAKIGNATIEGNAEEVAYILNGLIAYKEAEAPQNVKEFESQVPTTQRGTPYKIATPPLYKMKKRYRWRGKKIKYSAILGKPLVAWIKANFPKTGTETGKVRNKPIIKALRAAGVPYSVPKNTLTHSISSARNCLRMALKAPSKLYERQEVEDEEADQA